MDDSRQNNNKKSATTRLRKQGEKPQSIPTQNERQGASDPGKLAKTIKRPRPDPRGQDATELSVPNQDQTKVNTGQDTTQVNPILKLKGSAPQGDSFPSADLSFDCHEEKRSIAVGECLNHRFYLESLLGTGGMGEVYRARDIRRVEAQDTQPFVALKLLRQELRNDAKFIVTLQREAKKVQRLSHPNIVTMYDFDRDGSAAYITMEYLEGSSFDRVISDRKLKAEKGMYLIDRLARGLAFAHQEGYVHADIKPANIFLTNSNAVKILDFGIAQAVKKIQGHYVSVIDADANPDVHALTPNYASFEMLNGQLALPVDDVYSLCCVAYELLTGSHPFVDAEGNKVNALDAHTQGMTPKHIEGIPSYYADAIRQGLSFKRSERFENAGLLLDALKPKSKRKYIYAALATLVFITSFYIGFDTWNTQKVPRLASLNASMSFAANMIREGDVMLDEGDIDLAHRFYTQAWNEGNDTKDAEASLSTLKRILDNRMDKVTEALFEELKLHQDDEFRSQQIILSLEFIQKGSLGTLDKRISNAIEQ